MTELNGFEIGLIAANLFVLIVIVIYPFFIRKYLRQSAHTVIREANTAVVLAWLWVLFIIISNLELLGARLMTAEGIIMSLAPQWLIGHILLFGVFMDRLRKHGRVSLRILKSGLAIAIAGAFLFVSAFFGYAKLLLLLVMPFMFIAIVFSIPSLWPPRQRKDSTQKSS